MASKGTIRPEFWASCGLCGQEWVIVNNVPSTGQTPTNKGEVEEVLRQVLGWKRTTANGWCCPNHDDDGK